MRKFFPRLSIAFIVFLLFTFAAFAQETNQEDTKVFLWKAQSQTNTVYLLGSIHVAKDELYPLNQKIEDAFAQSDTLVVEANVLEVDPLKTQRLMMENAYYTGDDVLANHISKNSFKLIKSELAKYDVNLLQDCKYKPWYLAMLLEILELQRIGYNDSNGIDRHFFQAAKKQKKILELESVEWQIKMFSVLKDKQQEAYLLYTLDKYKNMGVCINELFDAWKIGDTRIFEKMVFEGVDKDPDKLAIHKMMITDRNIKMAAKIEGYLKNKETYFVVVGAGHFVGDEGIVSLLKKKGYTVEQM